jgi:hypothetical protein
MTAIEQVVLGSMTQNTTPTPEQGLRRRQIEAMVTCPYCFAHPGYSCQTNGLVDHPHDERVLRYMSCVILIDAGAPNKERDMGNLCHTSPFSNSFSLPSEFEKKLKKYTPLQLSTLALNVDLLLSGLPPMGCAPEFMEISTKLANHMRKMSGWYSMSRGNKNWRISNV